MFVFFFIISSIESNSELKLKVEVDGVPISQCNNVYRLQNVELTQNQLCAGGVKGKDSCRGKFTIKKKTKIKNVYLNIN